MKSRVLLLVIVFVLNGIVLKSQNNNLENDTLQNISFVKIEGLKTTKAKHCNKFLECIERTGAIPLSMVLNDVQTLWNTGLFSNVHYNTWVDNQGDTHLIFKVKEKFYYLPIFGVDASNENIKLTLGVLSYNLFGNGTTLSTTYQWYDRHSFEAMFNNPYLFNKHWGLGLQLSRWATLEPTQQIGNSGYPRNNNFEVTKWNAGGLVYYSPQFRNTFYLGGNYLKEHYFELIKEGETERVDFNIPKVLLKAGWQLNRANYFFQYVDGWYFQTEFANVLPNKSVSQNYFWKWENRVHYYKHVGKIHNLAMRAVVGFSTNEPMPFPAYVHDNYINLRGVGNRVGRGTSEFTLNTEWRTTIFNWDNAAIMGVAFVDASTLRPIASGWSELFSEELTHITTGIGLRFYLAKFYTGVFRVDYGIDVLNTKQHGLVLGLGHYF